MSYSSFTLLNIVKLRDKQILREEEISYKVKKLPMSGTIKFDVTINYLIFDKCNFFESKL